MDSDFVRVGAESFVLPHHGSHGASRTQDGSATKRMARAQRDGLAECGENAALTEVVLFCPRLSRLVADSGGEMAGHEWTCSGRVHGAGANHARVQDRCAVDSGSGG